MRVEGNWIRSDSTQSVMTMLEQGEHQAYFVGGCVRNALLAQPVGDVDIATDASPERVQVLASGAGFKCVPTGMDHGTVTVIADTVPHEITTFRRDVETDGRHAEVTFSSDIVEDARRRDFTMNALYATRDGTVIDPLNGLPDLKARLVRFIEDPGERIREEYLRILRFFRFHAWYGDPLGSMDAEALAAIAAHLDGLECLSRERVGAEMIRLLAAADPAPAVAAMRHVGALGHLLPGADDRALAPLVHLEQTAHVAPDSIRRLAALGGESIANRLRLPKSGARQLETLRSGSGSEMPPLELGYRHGAEMARSILLLRAAMLGRTVPPVDLKAVEIGAAAQFPVKAADLMQDFEGPALGAELHRLEALWLASGCRATRQELLQAGSKDA